VVGGCPCSGVGVPVRSDHKVRMKLCDECGTRPATWHSTIVIGDETRFSDLCHECFEALATPEEREFDAAQRDARCQYCGGLPCSGGSDFLALAMGVQGTRFMCHSCSLEFHRYVRQELAKCSEDLPQQEQLEAVRIVSEKAERHMRQWVEERRTK